MNDESSSAESDLRLVVRAADFAATKHRKQKRKDHAQTPYICHPLGVARILTEEAGITDACVVAAAMLHDTVEDTDTTFEEIKQHFGHKIMSVVQEVTDDKSLPAAERKRLQVVNGASKSPQAKLVKLADKLYNLRDLDRETPVGWSEERAQAYFEWACDVVVQLQGTNASMENELRKLFVKHNVDVTALPTQ